MYQFLYDQSVSDSRYRWHVFNRLRMWLARHVDPDVKYVLYGRSIALPFSHPLPIFLKIHPLYLANLARFAGFLRNRFGTLRMIDVGANVGDSYCCVDPYPGDSFLLIEGDPRFFRLLVLNTSLDPGVECEPVLLTDKPSRENGRLVSQPGNAGLSPDQMGAPSSSPFTTLDRLLESHTAFCGANLLKVDVEGYDRRVLAGGENLLRKSKPAVFFEYHPRKIAALKEDGDRIFGELAALGYDRYIVYDNLGYLMGVYLAADRERLGDLFRYGLTRGIYFDVGCFHSGRVALSEDYLRRERDFYRSVPAQACPADGEEPGKTETPKRQKNA
jgi:FkbM family methyltransferase